MSMAEKKRVLVIGGSGYLGQHLLDQLAKADGEVPFLLAFTHHRPVPPPELIDAISPVLHFRVDLRTGEGFKFISNTFGKFKADAGFEEAKHFIRSGAFGAYNYEPLLDSLEGNSGYGRGDYFLVGQDFPGYMDAQARVDEAYKDKKRWLKMSILSTAGCGKFSSDRTISQYAKEIWGINPCPVP